MLPNWLGQAVYEELVWVKASQKLTSVDQYFFFHLMTDWRKKFFQIFQVYLELGGYEDLA